MRYLKGTNNLEIVYNGYRDIDTSGYFCGVLPTPTLMNTGSITDHMVKRPRVTKCDHKRFKHTDIRYHSVGERVAAVGLTLGYIPTKGQLADIFTKALDVTIFRELRVLLLGN